MCLVGNFKNQIFDGAENYAPENELDWRWSPAWSIADFFKLLKDEFRAMHSIPFGSDTVYDVYTGYAEKNKGMFPMVQ